VSPGDAWFVTGDVLRVDADGDYWFVDRAADMIRTPKGPVASVAIEDALYELGEVKHAVAYGVQLPELGHDVPVATIVLREARPLDGVALARQLEARLDVNARPRFLRVADAVPMSVGYRPLKHPLRARPPAHAEEPGLLCYDHELQVYEPSTPERYARAIAQLRALEQPPPSTRPGDPHADELGPRPST
jgi:putative long chain acyl-CoA synthase